MSEKRSEAGEVGGIQREKPLDGLLLVIPVGDRREYAYRFQREEIVAVLRQIRRAAQLEIEHADDVRRAIESYAEGKGDFANYLLAERAIAYGCSGIATFDRALLADPRFISPDGP